MHEFNVAITALGILFILVGAFSHYIINRAPASVPMIAFFTGILVGPAALGLVDPESSPGFELILEEASRLTLAVAIMGVSFRASSKYIFHEWRPLAIMIGMVMPIMFLISGSLIYFMTGLPFWLSFLLGAAVTPTDPVLADSIVAGRIAEENVPGRLRKLISAESGANDGLAYALVLLPLLMLSSGPAALREWLLHVLVLNVGISAVAGAALGYATGVLLSRARKKESIVRSYFLGFTVAVALVALGGVRLIGSDGLFAVFSASIAFDHRLRGVEREQAHREDVQDVISLLFNLPAFVLLGMIVPWEGWLSLSWKGPALAGAVLLFRRLPALILLKPFLSPLHGYRDAFFVGWFGPIGISALFYIVLALRKEGTGEIWDLGTLIISASIIVHGVTATPFTRWYARTAKKK